MQTKEEKKKPEEFLRSTLKGERYSSSEKLSQILKHINVSNRESIGAKR